MTNTNVLKPWYKVRVLLIKGKITEMCRLLLITSNILQWDHCKWVDEFITGKSKYTSQWDHCKCVEKLIKCKSKYTSTFNTSYVWKMEKQIKDWSVFVHE